jgi:hypothetical protein
MAKKSKVKVLIQATSLTHYAKEVEIPQEYVDAYDNAVATNASERWFSDFAARWLDPLNDATDMGDDYEDVDMSIVPPSTPPAQSEP